MKDRIIIGLIGFALGWTVSPQLVGGQDNSRLEGTLSHLGFAVRDIDKSAKAFAELFGTEIPAVVTRRDISFPPGYGGAKMHVKYAHIVANGIRFELLQPLDGESPWKDYLTKHGEGLQHLAFEFKNVDATRRLLEQKGGRWTQASSPNSAYVDMEPTVPFTIEVVGPRAAQPARNAAQ